MLREGLAWHAYCWEEDKIAPSVAAASVKKALAPWSKVAPRGAPSRNISR